MHLLRALVILFAFLLGGSPLLAAGTISVTSSTHSVSAQATYLFRYIPDVNLTPQSTLQLTVGEAMNWPNTISAQDVTLSVNGNDVTLAASETATTYGFANPSQNVITITTPSSITIASGVSIELLVGVNQRYANPNTAGTTVYQLLVRNSALQNLDYVDGVILTQNLGVSVGAGQTAPVEENASGTSTSSGVQQDTATNTEAEQGTEETIQSPTTENTENTDTSQTQTPEEVALPPVTTYDATNDGVVDFVDVTILLESFEKFPTPEFDYDADGDVDTKDLSKHLSNWTPGTEVPTKQAPPIEPVVWQTTTSGSSSSGSSGSSMSTLSQEKKEKLKEMFAPEDVRLFALMSESPASVMRLRAREAGQRERYFVMLDTNEEGVNAVDMEIHYNPQELRFVESLTDQSIMNVWKYAPTVQEEGVLRLTAGSTEEFAGIGGFLCEIVFERLQGTDTIMTYEEVEVYRDGGRLAQVETRTEIQDVELYIASIESALEQDDEVSQTDADQTDAPEPVSEEPEESETDESKEEVEAVEKEYVQEEEEQIIPTLPAPALSSSTHPVEGKWYNQSEVNLQIVAENLVEYTVSQSRNSEDSAPWQLAQTAEVMLELSDGQWFIHTRSTDDDAVSLPSTFQVLIDTQSPEAFEIQMEYLINARGEETFLVFETTDALSGVAGYQVQQGSQTTVLDQGPFWIQQDHAGYFLYTVHAFDHAGNKRTQTVSFSQIAPARLLTSEQTAVVALLLTTFLLLIIRLVRARAR